ncbi:MAG: thiamine pyrophosphate-dependent enzyme [Candidatus Caldarchaeum sp.]|nr:thiamine pyrophosphate-dependent enzyme [Candidatus Caldarchaeum sp.]MDW7978674.1 thiamine pyrophosphate-dependent enzyme [Candidatus Caldarchaeum sp.]MDW8360447.1 thiamine pyrophosphate-dependent enzyme [Candidatus Caldarchaeum sp.]
MVTDDLLLRMYRDMVLARLFDSTMVTLQRTGKVAAYTSSEGQEAVSVAAAYAARQEDWIFPTYRETGAFIARGVPLEVLAARQLGKVGDPLKGHEVLLFGDRRYRIVTGPGPVGAHFPVAVGFGLAARKRGEDIVVLVFFGDGATSKGDFHEGLNFAGVFKAPAVFICQNNRYAISVPLSRQTASETVAVKAEAYGIEGCVVDGNDVVEVYNAVSKAAAKARSGEGPVLIEALTYRLAAHSTADDPTKYRPASEVEEMRKNDPILRCKNLLFSRNILNTEQDQKLRQQLAELVYRKIEETEKMPTLPPVAIFEDVYSTPLWNLEEEREEL